jgi:DNA-directed RNA polymerase subunit M/transcription elongation factor TFIIS
MFIYGAKKAYDKRQENKKLEAVGIDPKTLTDETRPICPKCGEKTKIDFAKRDEEGIEATWAKCIKCAEEWRYR